MRNKMNSSIFSHLILFPSLTDEFVLYNLNQYGCFSVFQFTRDTKMNMKEKNDYLYNSVAFIKILWWIRYSEIYIEKLK